jgi:carboxylesterase
MLFSPTFWPNGWAIPWYFSLFRLIQQKWIARLFHFRARMPHGIKDERLRSFILDSVQTETDAIEDLFARGGGLVIEFRRLVSNVKPLLGKIRQHTLVFHPRHDDQSDLKNALFLQRKLAGLVEVCVLDDCYHMVTLDRQRPIVMERVREFAERLTARLAKRTDAVAQQATQKETQGQAKGQGRGEGRSAT